MSKSEPTESKSELGEFLQARRAAVSPAAAGLPDTGRQRVPGLRREEVAALVGLSTDYYVRLEQGRGGRPSESMLEGIARVLQLDDTQRQHLYHLAHPRRRARRRVVEERVSEPARNLLETLTVPALVMTRTMQVIGWNDLACGLFTDFAARPDHERNNAWLLFLDEELAARHRDWEESARGTVGILRMTAGEDPDNPALTALVGELAVRSETFRRLWAEHHVFEKSSGLNLMRHPELGDIDLTYVAWTTPASPGQMLVTYTAEPGSPSAHALDLLGSMIAAERPASSVRAADTRWD
ncbi:helix-turn-helix transcriptional regulator [Amycolatopsis sp. GM8]|uniref:helix-turn-helix transcriptional regulator n=1 Tax=Amycolatopsis sp. GM8 TaxID=2896530 RepID=UPI001F37D441|nr:helix-turn-helix transcriptional regulator [Amycolatopsis sp. GM8]